MQNNLLTVALRILSHVVLAVMAASLLYAVYTALANWASIAV